MFFFDRISKNKIATQLIYWGVFIYIGTKIIGHESKANGIEVKGSFTTDLRHELNP